MRDKWTAKPGTFGLAGVILLGVGLPLAAAAISGNLAIPHNDSWVYSRVADTFWRTGRIRLLNYGDTTMIGQIFILGPLAMSFVASQVGVAVLASAALWCCYKLAASVTTTVGALLVTLVLALSPGFASLATSFMTDVPALLASLLAVLIGRRALSDDSPRLLLLSLVIGFVGLTIREPAVSAPVAVLIVGLVTRKTRTKLTTRYLVVASATLLVAALIFLAWRGSLANGQDPHLTLNLSQLPQEVVDDAGATYFTLAAVLAPLALLVARPWRWRWNSWVLVALVGWVAVHMDHQHLGLVLGDNSTGNYFRATGEYDYVMNGGRYVISSGLWNLVHPLVVVGGLAMAGELGASWRRCDPVLGAFTALMFIGVVAVGVLYWLGYLVLFDRYLIAIIPGLGAVLLSRWRRPDERRHGGRRAAAVARLVLPVRAIAAIASFVVIAMISVLLTLNGFAFDAARWHDASQVEASGVEGDRIDAGIEWNGWHAPGVMAGTFPWVASVPADEQGDFSDYTPQLDPKMPCVVTSSTPMTPGGSMGSRAGRLALLAVRPYHTYLIAGTSDLYLYSTGAAGCPHESAAS